MPSRIGPNEPCDCGSGKKFKKCCGALGRVTDPVQAEQDAIHEEYLRERAKNPRKRGSMVPFILGFSALAHEALSGPGPLPPRPRKRGRRKK